jgi:Holliday junction DNA helicase RuvA
MIASVRGTLRIVGEHSIVLELPGGAIALEVFVPRVALDTLPAQIGQPIELSTITTVESQAQGATLVPRLLGFLTPAQRDLFEHLTRVKGLGPRRALRAMAADAGAIAAAIVNNDTKALSRLPEIGKKLAESMVLELKDKVGALALDAELGGQRGGRGTDSGGGQAGLAQRGRPEHAERAIAALVKLGESLTGAEQLVDAALRDQPALATADEVLAAAFARRG